MTTTYRVGLPTSVTSTQNLSSSYVYQRNLSLQSIAYGNTMSSVFGPDPHGLSRPRRIRHAKGAQTLFDSGLYEYDGVGNTWKIGADRFLYDRVGRLTLGTVRQAGAGHQETYAYDGFGNVLERVRNQGSPTTFSTDHKNRLLGAFDDVDYDAAGHMRQIGLLLDGSPNITAEWDGLGMQLAFKRHAPQFQQYVYIYGPGNLRLLSFDSSEGALTWNQRDLSGKILRTWRHTGSLDVSSPASIYQYDKDYLYGPQGMFASYSAAGETAYFHNDHLGSPRLITNQHGQAIGRHHYYPFGDEVFPGAPYDDRICKFTGHERDPNKGTDYMLGRTYVFSFQRFMSVDPGRDGWNLYAYVGNNPISFVDPDGYELQLVGSEGAVSQAQEIVNSGLFGQELAVDSGGTATLVPNGLQGPQTVEQQALSGELSKVIGNTGTTTLRLTQSSFIIGGDFSSGVVDVGDISKFGMEEPLSQSSAFLHEVIEQFQRQVFRVKDFGPAHQTAMDAEQRIHGMVRGADSPARVGGLGASITTFTGKSGQVAVTTRVRMGNIVDVMRKRK